MSFEQPISSSADIQFTSFTILNGLNATLCNGLSCEVNSLKTTEQQGNSHVSFIFSNLPFAISFIIFVIGFQSQGRVCTDDVWLCLQGWHCTSILLCNVIFCNLLYSLCSREVYQCCTVHTSTGRHCWRPALLPALV